MLNFALLSSDLALLLNFPLLDSGGREEAEAKRGGGCLCSCLSVLLLSAMYPQT